MSALAGCPGESRDTRTVTPAEVPTETATAVQTPTETGEVVTQRARLVPDDSDGSDEFGESVAVSSDGTTALIGAPGDEDPNGQFAGSAYVFEGSGDGWTQQTKLAAGDGDEFDGFGQSVAVSSDGTTALVGAREDEDPNGEFAGSAYVFGVSGGAWMERAKLVPDDGDRSDGFGWAVAVSDDGTTALVSARNDEDPNGSLSGSAYIFEVEDGSWTQRTKLTAEDGDGFDTFGEAVTLSSDGTTALISAPADEDPNGSLAGAVYAFEAADGDWTQRAKLTPGDGDGQDLFGWSVAVSSDGTTALVTAYSDDDPNGDEAGSAYVFEATGGSWTQQAKLAASDGDSSDFFGFTAAVTDGGTTAVVSAPGEENGTTESAGAAYVFENTDGSWTQQVKLAADDGDSEDLLGRGVGVSGDGTTALVGAPFDGDQDGEFAGSVAVFTL